MANKSRILGSKASKLRRVDPKRASKKAIHNLYDRQWRKARVSYLQDHPLCVMCAKKGIIKEAEHIDHIVPHRGNRRLFWRLSNWQPLCAKCHKMKTVREDGAFGNPVLSHQPTE